ncbi:MAG TPA: pyridoxamine 5'-phosphate oxidase family protein [Ktedonobacteraceae bacterium]
MVQTTMWYLLEDDTIVMNTKAGRVKDRNLRRDPRISICIEGGYNYLTISGSVELIEDQETAQRDIRRLAVRYDGEESAEQQMARQFSKEQRVTIHLKPEHIIENL